MNSALVNRKRVKNGGDPGKSKTGIYRLARLEYNGEQLGRLILAVTVVTRKVRIDFSALLKRGPKVEALLF